jgi:hypothetical protein
VTKVTGCCLRCRKPQYQVETQHDTGPLAGQPARYHTMAETGCQVEALLDDGSVTHLTMCLRCARKLKPEHYPEMWAAVVAHRKLVSQAAGRTANQVARDVGQLASRWILGLIGARRESAVEPGRLTTERRWRG